MNIRLLLDRLLPAQPCLLCLSPSRNGLCCDACRNQLPRLTAAQCPVCALPSPMGATCGRCLRKPPAFDRTAAAFAYDFPLDKLIHALKFHEKLELADFLAEQLATRISQRPDFLIPLPLHAVRLRERGFNQSLLLAKSLGRKLDIPLQPDACHRVRDTAPQSSLPFRQRTRNMRDAFVCTADLSGKHIAIVDDVMTTGSSIGELSRALRKQGAAGIDAWVVARALPRNRR